MSQEPHISHLLKSPENILFGLVFKLNNSYVSIERDYKHSYNIEFVRDGFARNRRYFIPTESLLTELHYFLLESIGEANTNLFHSLVNMSEDVITSKCFKWERRFESIDYYGRTSLYDNAIYENQTKKQIIIH